MKLLTVREQIRGVADRWRKWCGSRVLSEKHRTILDRLEAIDVETATPEDVAAIIGNVSWACDQQCHECGENCGNVVQLGEEFDYESCTACICLACLKKAVALAEGG